MSTHSKKPYECNIDSIEDCIANIKRKKTLLFQFYEKLELGKMERYHEDPREPYHEAVLVLHFIRDKIESRMKKLDLKFSDYIRKVKTEEKEFNLLLDAGEDEKNFQISINLEALAMPKLA